MECHSPLVTVVVITYNSSKYVIETLDSIYNQTYTNLELIISDDCSKDDTIKICEDWLKKNGNRFYHTEIITTEINTGIPANCNRGFDKAQGEWIKYIAADDCLYPHAIDKYISVAIDKDYKILFSNMDIFMDTFEDTNKIQEKQIPPSVFKKNKSDANTQFRILTIGNQIYAPAVFIKKELYKYVGKFDEDIKLCEDWPMWLKITRFGYAFYYIDEPLIKYRKYQESTWGKQYINKKYIVTKGEDVINERYIFPYVDKFVKLILTFDYYLRNRLNSSKLKCNYLYVFLIKVCSFCKRVLFAKYNNSLFRKRK